MIATEFTPGAVFSRTKEMVRANGRPVAIALVTMTALSMLSELVSLTLGLGEFIVALIFQYDLTRRALDHEGLLRAQASRYRILALVGLSILTTAGTLLGLLLLLLPGLYLAARWSIALPILIAEEKGVFDSIGRSWDETKGRGWVVVAILVPIYAPMLISAPLISFRSEGTFLMTIGTAIWDPIVNACLIVGWHAAVAIYSMLETRQNLHEVFA